MTLWKYLRQMYTSRTPFLFWLAVSVMAFLWTGTLYFIKQILFG